jgi:hypothetical protein
MDLLPSELWGEIRSHLTLSFDKVALQRVCKLTYAAHKGPVCGPLEQEFLRLMLARGLFDEDEPLRLPDPWRYRPHPDLLPQALQLLPFLALLDSAGLAPRDRTSFGTYENGVIRVLIRYEVPEALFDHLEITAFAPNCWSLCKVDATGQGVHRLYRDVESCMKLADIVVQQLTKRLQPL